MAQSFDEQADRANGADASAGVAVSGRKHHTASAAAWMGVCVGLALGFVVGRASQSRLPPAGAAQVTSEARPAPGADKPAKKKTKAKHKQKSEQH
jgi:hypothetical protein